MVLAGGESGYLQIWDLINVQEVCRITAHEGKNVTQTRYEQRQKNGWRQNEGKDSAGGQKFVHFSHQAPLPLFFVFRAVHK